MILTIECPWAVGSSGTASELRERELTVDVGDLDSGQLIQLNGKPGSDLYRFLGQYPNGTVTVEWLFTWPRGADSGYLPARTSVTRLHPDQLFDFITPSDRIIELYRGVCDGSIAPAPHPEASV